MTPSRARIQFLFPRKVLISPKLAISTKFAPRIYEWHYHCELPIVEAERGPRTGTCSWRNGSAQERNGLRNQRSLDHSNTGKPGQEQAGPCKQCSCLKGSIDKTSCEGQ